jgi:hypothetical protein
MSNELTNGYPYGKLELVWMDPKEAKPNPSNFIEYQNDVRNC